MKSCDIALYGLGVMGSSLAKNMIGHGFRVAAYSKSEEERRRFALPGSESGYVVCADVQELLASLKRPRIVFMMVTAGAAVDSVIGELLPYLERDDVLIDGGNSHFRDTARRCEHLEDRGIRFLGVGVSGGEKGALLGPSLMVGGSRDGWMCCRRILETIAAHCGEETCCAYIAAQGAGHYVKMVHNGIEYAILELIAETYHLMRYGLKFTHKETTDTFREWQSSRLDSYLMDISVRVLEKMDDDGTPLVEKILDVAEQKGTGRWTLQDAVERGVYIPTIFEAVFARCVSSGKAVRVEGKRSLSATTAPFIMENSREKLRDALLLGMILSYAQGMALIAKASEENGWDIDPVKLVGVWRAGCIIWSELLTEVRTALSEEKANLILTDTFSGVAALEPALRETVTGAQRAAIAIPALTSALNYYDSFRMEQMPVNFVQALRDCFGAHTYRRVDKEGYFHTEWE
ncbi:MAG: NADP-dependent phosphogluconate dehydrogenase [Lachnospiraceae bacterium]|nr:NADP-dependent phosphogluconate dehydrogenase [Lachnospiraceae bacterium]